MRSGNFKSQPEGGMASILPFRDRRAKKLGQILLESGQIAPSSLAEALTSQKHLQKPIGEILVANEQLEPRTLVTALSRQSALDQLQKTDQPTCFETDDPTFWIDAGLIPWDQIGGFWRIACHDRANYLKHKSVIEQKIGPSIMVWAEVKDIRLRQNDLFKEYLVSYAQECLPQEQSCRSHLIFSRVRPLETIMLVLVFSLLAVGIGAVLFWGAVGFTLFCLTTMSLLKLSALFAVVNQKSQPPEQTAELPLNIPKITLLIPLYREKNIAKTLVKNLKKLRYPPTHLEAMLVLEADDEQTAHTLAQTDLPPWMHVLQAYGGSIKTKPRALNYALPFCTGEIIGIYDAEDAPEPDQLIKVAAQFETADPKTVCLQGRLAYFNRDASIISRCFWLDYSTWFRIILPGIARMGFLIPLGGTTLFFKTDILRKIGDGMPST